MNAIAAVADQLAARAPAKRPPSTGGRPPTLSIDQRFGQWTVIGYEPGSKSVGGKWRCRCTCGTVRLVLATSLTSGRSRSCGHDTGGRPVKERP